MCNYFGLQTVPQLYRGMWDTEKIKLCYTGNSVFKPAEQEGYVVRLEESIQFEDHAIGTGKFVRPNHVPGSIHWTKSSYIKNGTAT